MTRAAFGALPDGRRVDRLAIAAGDLAVDVLTYGAILASVRVPDAAGEVTDVALGFDTLEGWLHDPQYFGAVVGRFANRIRGARFPLDGRSVEVTPNRGEHHLHGGARGFDTVVWEVEAAEADRVVLRHESPAGDEGYPGNLTAHVEYRAVPPAALEIRYRATTDAPTVVNPTNHVYLDLTGGDGVLDHEVALASSAFLEVDEATIPTGRILGVSGTPLDFRTPRRLGDRIDEPHPQLRLAGGYDHCFVVDGAPGVLRPCATVAAGGRTLAVETTQPGVQLYSGHAIRRRVGRGGAVYGPHSGLCLETEGFPDAPNHPHFPSTRLDPGSVLEETTVYRFS